MEKTSNLYTFIEAYAENKQLKNTLIALPLAKELLANFLFRASKIEKNETSSFDHCMDATKMLIDLHIMLPAEEEDILLASMLCHNLLTNIKFPKNGLELVHTHHLDPRVLEIIQCITRPSVMSEEYKTQYYNRIHDNKLAVFVALADRGNVVEQLSKLDISEVNELIIEMRKYILPMCVSAKQYYRDCHMSITILMEKIRCLIDVTDIIAKRYQKRELAYSNEILSITEENARLRGMIHQLEIGEIQ